MQGDEPKLDAVIRARLAKMDEVGKAPFKQAMEQLRQRLRDREGLTPP